MQSEKNMTLSWVYIYEALFLCICVPTPAADNRAGLGGVWTYPCLLVGADKRRDSVLAGVFGSDMNSRTLCQNVYHGSGQLT